MSDMDTYFSTISIGTSNDLESDHYSGGFGDEWAAVGIDPQDPTYDEDLSLPSDIINTLSIPEMTGGPFGSHATADTTNEASDPEQDDVSQEKGDSLPYSDEYSDVYLDI